MDPATWSWLTCAWLIETSIGGILGNRLDAKATDVWGQGWQAFTQKMRGDYPTAINQDLEVAAHRAFLLAQRSLVCDCLAEFTGGSWTEPGMNQSIVRADYAVLPGYSEQDVSWLQTQLTQIKTELKKLQKGDCSAIPSRALDTSMALLLTDRGMASKDAESLLRDGLAKNVLAGATPDSYRVRATAEGTGLFERIAAFFAFELKTNVKVQSLFQNQLLVQINRQLEGLSAEPVALDEIEGLLKAFAEQLPEVLASLDNLEIAVKDLGKSVDEVGWLVASRTDYLIGLAISYADDLAELKRLVSDCLRQLQQQLSTPTVVIQSSSGIPRVREGVNPFIYGPAVPPACFYGRKAQLAHIKQRIGGKAPQCVNVVGFRRNGKSSVLRYVRESIDEFCPPEQKPIVVSLDLQDKRFHQPAGIIEGLRRNIEKKVGKAPWTKADNDDLFEVEDGLEDLRSQGYRLIVLFDEFEAVGERLEVFHDWGDHWRSQASAGRLSLVIASKRPVSEIYQVLGLTSPFGNIFSTTVLGALDEEAWQRLLADGNLSVEENCWAYELGGQLPYYAQLAAAMIWQHSSLESARRDFLQQAQGRFVALWKGLSQAEQLALQYSANSSLSRPQPAIVENLQLHGLLRADRQVFSESFSGFMRQQL